MDSENQPEVHVTVVESPAPSSTDPEVVELAQDKLSETLGTAAALVDMAKDLGGADEQNRTLESMRDELSETNRLLRDLIGEMRATREKVEEGNELQAADIVTDVAIAEAETEATEESAAEIGTVVEEAIEEVAEKVEAPKERRRRWI